MNGYYTEYSDFLNRLFPGGKVQKLSINTNSSCPNRDGTIGSKGCIYCNNKSFTPSYCFNTKDIRQQVREGINFFGRKYPTMGYIAYLQSYTSTHDASKFINTVSILSEMEELKGIIVGTRPDCISNQIIEVLKEISHKKKIIVELGIESLHDHTLRLINRGHDSATSIDAIMHIAEAGFHPGVHIIAGLPRETSEDVISTVRTLCTLPIEVIKLHQLQILKDTELERRWLKGEIPVHPYSLEEYIELCIKIIKLIPRHIAIDRFVSQAPEDMIIAPKWGIKNYMFTQMLKNRLKELQTNG